MSSSAHKLPAPWQLEQIVLLLSQTIGEEKARDVIGAASFSLGLDLSVGLAEAGVLRLLDRIAESPGIVGITARFAKSRVHLGQKPG